MSVQLRPLREDEFEGWRAASEAGYADDMIRNAGLSPERAHDKAARDFARSFPDGHASPGQHTWVIEDAAGSPVGHCWLGERDTPDGGRFAFVFDIGIDDAYRGRGYGRAAMLLLEDEARALGQTRIELNVFGGNEVARGLYRSLGYEELAVSMGKDIA